MHVILEIFHKFCEGWFLENPFLLDPQYQKGPWAKEIISWLFTNQNKANYDPSPPHKKKKLPNNKVLTVSLMSLCRYTILTLKEIVFNETNSSHLYNKFVVNIFLCQIRLEVWWFENPQKELIYYLKCKDKKFIKILAEKHTKLNFGGRAIWLLLVTWRCGQAASKDGSSSSGSNSAPFGLDGGGRTRNTLRAN